jgi:Ni,Fe-hydrogenase maturation factor
VRVITGHQLTPELADPLSCAEMAVFIDAACDQETVRIRPLSNAATSDLRPHSSQPQQLLALASHLFGRSPRAWLITIPAFDLGFGQGLSDQGHRAMDTALAAFQELVEPQ